MRRTSFYCFYLLLFVSGLNAQGAGKEIIRQHQIWYDFTETVRVHPRWSVVLNLSERHSIKPFFQSQTLVRTYFLYHFKSNWSVGTGFVHFWTWDDKLAVPELRPEQWLFYRQNFEKVKILSLLHRYKIEERFIRNTENEKLLNTYTFTMRFRYMLRMELILFTTGKNNNPFKLLVSDEIMLNAGKSIVYNVFDQNRATAGVSYRPLEGLTLSFVYMNLFRQRRSGNIYDDIHTLRFGIEHEITMKQRQKDKL